jgi:hypothetical protein
VDSAAELVDLAAVALGGAAFGDGSEFEHLFAFFGGFGAEYAALGGLAVEGLGDGGGASDLAEDEDFDVEDAGVAGDLEHVAEADVAGGFGAVGVGLDAADVAGVGGEGACFEEPGGPEPFVHAYGGGGHGSIFADLGMAWRSGRCSGL